MTDRLALDHLVYAVPDLASAIVEIKKRLGLAPRFGGRHSGLGTHNAILPLAGETYLELIASDLDGPSPNQPRPFGLDTLHDPRLVSWAVRSRSIDADVERARERGFDPGHVLRMTREEPDGKTLHWKLTLRKQLFGDGLVPFVIDWGHARHPTVAAGSALNDIANDSPEPRCSLTSFSAVHPKPEPIQAALAALGARLLIRPGAKASLNACLRGPAGSLELGDTS